MENDQVDVTPEAFPGGSFNEEDREKLTVAQLMF